MIVRSSIATQLRAGIAVTFAGLWLAAPARALEPGETPEVEAFIQEMSAKYQLDPESLHEIFARVEIRDDILEAMRRPAEARPWHEYRQIFVTDESVRNGAKFWKKHARTLERASAEYGVEPEIIVAIIGVETRYGRSTGRYRVIDALTTLAFRYPERAAFFRKELEEYLLLCLELDVGPLTFNGSYAGAMGAPQFIPSSYRRYAVDFDGDGRRDLLGSMDDAIGSVANYFRAHGWRRGEPVVTEARIEGTPYAWMESDRAEPNVSLKRMREYGVLPVRDIDIEQLATLVSLEGEDGVVHRLGYRNFYVITRYNRSKRYAMAVWELSVMIKERYAGESG